MAAPRRHNFKHKISCQDKDNLKPGTTEQLKTDEPWDNNVNYNFIKQMV